MSRQGRRLADRECVCIAADRRPPVAGMAKEVTDLDLFGGGAGEDDFFGSMSDSSQPSSATSAAAAAASLASPGSGDDLFGTGGDAGDYDDIFGLGDPGGSSYGGSATQPAPAPEPEVAPVAALKAAAPAPTELEVKADAEQDTAAVEELNSPQLFGDDGGDFMAALSMRDPEPQPAPQPAYRPAPQPAPQPAPLPAPSPRTSRRRSRRRSRRHTSQPPRQRKLWTRSRRSWALPSQSRPNPRLSPMLGENCGTQKAARTTSTCRRRNLGGISRPRW